MIRRIKRAVAEKLQYLHAAYVDLRLLATGKSDRELPPLRLRFVGTGDFRGVGEDILLELRETGGLQPHHDVLDVGCGVGRVALPLARFLSPDATYHGFDVVRSGIRWCRRNIAKRRPNFHFTHVNVYNTFYNRRGARAWEVHFPYADRSFDFAFATSVFTHLDVETARHYIDELHRVLRPGGTMLATFFLLDEEVKRRLANARFTFPHDLGRYRLEDAETPEMAIAFDESLVREFLPAEKWRNVRIQRGPWAGGEGRGLQDVVVAERV